MVGPRCSSPSSSLHAGAVIPELTVQTAWGEGWGEGGEGGKRGEARGRIDGDGVHNSYM